MRLSNAVVLSLTTAAAVMSSSSVVLVQGLASSSSSSTTAVAGARRLGKTDLVVSEACLGTMTWGLQNSQEEAFEQMDYALNECGVNFLDAAELYPVPMTAPEWQAGGTETIIGNYLAKNKGRRNNLVIASKVAGYIPNSAVATARHEEPKGTIEDCRLDEKSVKTACAASLRRLKTDYIDLYQVHWPDRYIPLFGKTLYDYKAKRDDAVPIEETVSAMRDLLDEGKVRYIGVSNESPWGLCQWVQACEKYGIADKLATIQNSYSLVDRRVEGDLAEVCDAHQIGVLPWSVLAGGLLSGKYVNNKDNAQQQTLDVTNSRYTLYPEFMSRWSPASAAPQTLSAAQQYAEISRQAGMTPAESAVAFCRSRKFIADNGSTILGATTMQQLKENLEPFRQPVILSDDVLEAIDKVHAQCPNPSCSL